MTIDYKKQIEDLKNMAQQFLNKVAVLEEQQMRKQGEFNAFEADITVSKYKDKGLIAIIPTQKLPKEILPSDDFRCLPVRIRIERTPSPSTITPESLPPLELYPEKKWHPQPSRVAEKDGKYVVYYKRDTVELEKGVVEQAYKQFLEELKKVGKPIGVHKLFTDVNLPFQNKVALERVILHIIESDNRMGYIKARTGHHGTREIKQFFIKEPPPELYSNGDVIKQYYQQDRELKK